MIWFKSERLKNPVIFMPVPHISKYVENGKSCFIFLTHKHSNVINVSFSNTIW